MIREQYTALLTEQLLQGEASGLTWSQQLIALGKKIRLLTTQLALKRQHAEQTSTQYETTIAQLIEQQRDLQARLQQLMQSQGQPSAPEPGK